MDFFEKVFMFAMHRIDHHHELGSKAAIVSGSLTMAAFDPTHDLCRIHM